MTPRTLTELRARLLDGSDPLSPRLREVRRYVLERPQSIALDTVAVIAEQAGVPPSTLVRFAREFGFDGFSAMQKLYKADLHRRYDDYGERIRRLRDRRGDADAGTPLAFVHELADAQRAALGRLASTLEPARLERAVALVDAAETVHVCGVRRAFPVVAYLAYALARLGVRCHAIDGLGLMHREQAGTMRAGDLLVAVTYHPYAQTVRDIVAAAGERGVRVLLLTDDDDAPSAALADTVLAVRDTETNGFRSLDASLCVAQALCLAVGFRRGGGGGDALERPVSPA